MQRQFPKLSKPIIVLAILFVILAIGPSFLGFYTDWLWFSEIGFEKVFSVTLITKILAALATAVVIFVFLYLNIAVIRRFTSDGPLNITINKAGEIEKLDISGHVKKLMIPAAALVAFLGGLVGASQWEVILQFLNQTPFGTVDPIFGRDIGYYVFSLPFIQVIIGLMSFVLVVSIVFAFLFYIFKGALVFKKRIAATGLKGIFNDLVSITKEAKTHLLVLIAIFFLVKAVAAYLVAMPMLLFSDTGPFFGASYTDINAFLPFIKLLIVTEIIAAALTLYGIRRGFRHLALAVALYIGVSVLGGVAYPAALQNFVVTPNELVKETPYIQNHISATQKAWGLDKVEKRDLTGDSQLTLEDIKDNESTIKNIRLWDREPLLQTFGQIQEIRTYYDFVSVDDDRYKFGDEYRQVMLSPRELNSDSLPLRNFINEHLTFTHGMGLTLGPVNEITPEGLPVLFTQDLPPTSTLPELKIDRPEIYYGELSSEYVVVKTKSKEFDYPSGEENVFATYEGAGGVPIGSLLRKLVFAWRFQSLKIFLSNDITNESRIMFHRDIRERAAKALPFLTFDRDPFMVITEGKLKWIYDAYTTSSGYPYAQQIGGINYMRNSVKLVIDAYDGSIEAYIADAEDPIIQTYEKIYKGIFKPISEMPDDLRSHVRYPEDLFTIQTALYKIYHMEQPQIFYNKEDEWSVPVVRGGVSNAQSGPVLRHLIMKLPEEEQEEFILMTPYTPRLKDNMSAWFVARNDGEHYGELIVYRFSKQALVFGPQQIVNRINQDPEISAQLSLWDQRGSQVIQGNLYVIPINESILYVRPLYIRAEGGRIPELKRVIVAYENNIAMEDTLEKSLARVFGGSVSGSGPSVTVSAPAISAVDSTRDELLKQAQLHFARAESAQKQGNWSLYGEEIRQLGEVLDSLNL